MASSVTSEPRYFCHTCNHQHKLKTGSTPPESPTCPHCGSEFVEALESEVLGGGASTPSKQPAMDDTDDPEPERIPFPQSQRANLHPLFQHFPPGEPLMTIRVPPRQPLAMQLHEHVVSMMDEHRARMRQEEESQQQSTRQETPAGGGEATPQAKPRQDSTDSNPPPAQRPRPNNPPPPFRPPSSSGNDLSDLHFNVGMPWHFMTQHRAATQQQQASGMDRQRQFQLAAARAMVGPPLVVGFTGSIGNMEVLHSSPADYIVNSQVFDDMITQMLSNLGDSGPPPAEPKKIEQLPTVLSTPENMESCKSCSVCKEDFDMGESLLQLPCTHLYHRDCVLPWLKLHDTCPTCRFHLNSGQADRDKGPV